MIPEDLILKDDLEIVFDGEMPCIKLETDVRMFDVTFYYYSDVQEHKKDLHHQDLMKELKKWFKENGRDKENYRGE